MLRAISEMASAMMVCSVLEKPMPPASARPFWRAVTMSSSRSIGTWTSAGTTAAPPCEGCQVIETFFEIERRYDALEVQAQLHHGERDVWLDADNDRARTSQLGDVHDRAKGACCEGIQDVERGHVDDHPTAPVGAHLTGELVAKLDEILVGQRRLNRRDEYFALLQDRYGHGLSLPR